MPVSSCPLCNGPAEVQPDSMGGFYEIVDCPTCRRFEITSGARIAISGQDALRTILSSEALRRAEKNEKLVISVDYLKRLSS